MYGCTGPPEVVQEALSDLKIGGWGLRYYVMLFLSHTTLVPWRGLERGGRFGGNPGSRRRLEPAPQYRFPRSESSSLQTDLFPTQ